MKDDGDKGRGRSKTQQGARRGRLEAYRTERQGQEEQSVSEVKEGAGRDPDIEAARSSLLGLRRNWSGDILALFNKAVQETEEEYNRQNDGLVSLERSKTINSFYKNLTDAQKYIRENYRKELWVKGEYYRNRKWITEDEAIMAALKKRSFSRSHSIWIRPTLIGKALGRANSQEAKST